MFLFYQISLFFENPRFLYDNINMTMNKSHIFTLAAFALFVIMTPRLCAQNSVSAEKAESLRQEFCNYGKKFIGCKYVSGATGPNTFDCSGFVYTVSRESIGYQLPRQVKAMYSYCKSITDADRQAGDLVFFKTTSSGEVSHVGIYIGNGQFLHCASDGPNTGVIVSSLRENYWKGKYYKSGRFLPAGNETQSPSSASSGTASGTYASASGSSSSGSSQSGSSFLSKLLVDGSLSFDWNFFDADNFRLNFRGLTGNLQFRYNSGNFQPGAGTSFRWDSGTGTIQLPIFASLTIGEYFSIFAGPVICIGTPYLPGNDDEEIESSFFPGIIGVCWNTPSFDVKKAKVCFTQDIHYTVFNKTDGSALSPVKSAASGLVFSSGVRVTLPLSQML